ncbi:putative serine/threonine-protein kinase [Platanthera guangdongensis]|uniref:Serine/threonine-protein kinase n=1 Tax=Platanthera guangdongensis TaxID=2320717 RepID=A0ABR2N0S2_9ASPA
MSFHSALSQLFFFTIFCSPYASFFSVCGADSSCPQQQFTCGNATLPIKFPFYTNDSVSPCSGVHFIQCIDLVPAVRFYGNDYLYPVRTISYPDKTITIHDLKLSSYFRGSNCEFLYDFQAPIQGFNFTSLSVSLGSGESFFSCKDNYAFSRDIFFLDYNLSLCGNYSLYYFKDAGDENSVLLPSACSAYQDLWFHWTLSFGDGKDGRKTSLLRAGFSPRWTGTDCFTCQFSANNCSDELGYACSCISSCKGAQKNRSKGIIIGVSLAGGIGFFIISIIFCFRYLQSRKRRHRQRTPNQTASSTLLFYQSSIISHPFTENGQEISSTHIFSYDELYKATNSFDTAMEIGDGGFGTVYRGKLRDGRDVAVKRLYESNIKRVEQFANEIVILSRLRHQNLVSLYGCTSPRSRELILVYEFVSNGTVADHLHGERSQEGLLTWQLRLSIAVETATALAYLHAVDPPIIHRDVKTGNILLDAEFHVKIADFGLSRLFPPDGAAYISTAPQGTPGYLDPEYHQSYQLTDKSDVYSFGVVLAELITSKPAVDLGRNRLEINLSTMALNRIQNGNLDELMDRKLGFDSDRETNRMMRLVGELAFQCLQVDREMRPPIKEVLEVLKGIKNRSFVKHSGELAECTAGKANEKRPSSPDSVMEKWMSWSQTPNSSH